MSEQPDIERIIEGQLLDLTLPCDMRYIRIRMAGAIQQCLASKDTEIARLDEELINARGESAQRLIEIDQLRARLAEERTLTDLLASSLTGETPMLAAIMEYAKTLADPNEPRMVMTKFAQRNARQLALESQCRKMRDALKGWENRDLDWDVVHTEHGKKAVQDWRSLCADALSSSIDLELLARVVEILEEWVSRVPVMPGDPQRQTYNKTNALLKSLNPAK